jgi:uncharacterized protein (TIGR03066 family)
MRAWRLLVVGLLVAGLGTGLKAEEKKAEGIKEKLVGTWEVTRADEGTVPVGSTVVVTKDGKVKLTVKVDNQEEIHEGTYKVGDKQVTFLRKEGDKVHKHVLKIRTLTATVFAVEDEEGKKVDLKRKK